MPRDVGQPDDRMTGVEGDAHFPIDLLVVSNKGDRNFKSRGLTVTHRLGLRSHLATRIVGHRG